MVQIVIDNGSTFVKAGKELMKKYIIYWTSCVSYCIDLMIKEIGKMPSVKGVIDDVTMVTNFIYNHTWLLTKMRQVYHGGW